MSHSSIEKSFSRAAILTIVIAVLTGVCNYFTRRELSVLLDLQTFGLLYSAISIFNLTLAGVDVGLNNTLTTLLSRYSVQNNYAHCRKLYGKVLLLKIVIIATVVAFFCVFSDEICERFFHYPAGSHIFRIASLYCVSYALLLTFSAALNGVKAFFQMNLLQFFFFFTPSVVLLSVHPDCPSFAVGCFVAGSFVVIPLALFFIYRQAEFKPVPGAPGTSCSPWGELFSLGRWFFVGNVLLTAMSSMDIILLGGCLGPEATGQYNIAVAISMLCAPLVFAANLGLSVVAAGWTRKDLAGIRNLVSRIFFVWSTVFWLGCVGFLLLAPEIILLLFSAEFLTAVPATRVLGPAVILSTLQLFLYGALNGIGEAKKANLLLIIGVIANGVINGIAARKIGIVGGAWGTFGGYAVAALLTFYFVRKKIKGIVFPLGLNIAGILVFCLGLQLISASIFIRIGYCLGLGVIGALIVIRTMRRDPDHLSQRV